MPTAVIVGYGPGIGASMARKLVARGHDLAIIGRGETVEAQAAALAGGTARVMGLVADAGRPDSLRDALVAVAAAFGPPSLLHYNAAAVRLAAPSALDAAALLTDLAVSVGGVLTAVQALLPGMVAAGSGTILLTGGGFALRPSAALASLGVGKAALRNLAFSLAEELGPRGIRVGTVTILGQVAAGTALDPDLVADKLLALANDTDRALGVEIQFAG